MASLLQPEKKNKSYLTIGDSSKLLKQFHVGLWLNGGGDVRLTACCFQQGIVVEQAVLVGSLHRGQNIPGHMAVEGPRVALQSVKQSKGCTPGLNFLGGKSERMGGGGRSKC